MNKFTIKIDYSNFLNHEFQNYMNTLKGIKSVNIDSQQETISIEYDSSVIFLNILNKEIQLYLDIKKIPSIISFDKHDINNLSKYTIVIKKLCCEFCLKGMITDLIEIEGINSAYTDFNYINKHNVNIFITYNNKIISQDDIIKLNKKLNN